MDKRPSWLDVMFYCIVAVTSAADVLKHHWGELALAGFLVLLYELLVIWDRSEEE